jgi:hypothetical protein
MYTMDQAAQLAMEFARQKSADFESEIALFEEDGARAEKGDFFYFACQSTKYLETRVESDMLYGLGLISVHSVTGECRLLSPQESWAVDPFSA